MLKPDPDADTALPAAGTTTAMVYDQLRRVRNLTTFRSSLPAWNNVDFTQ